MTMTMSRRNQNNDHQPDRREENIPSPLIRDYFIDNGSEIKNQGYVNNTKRLENMRIITLNIKGCRMNNKHRIEEIRESIENIK